MPMPSPQKLLKVAGAALAGAMGVALPASAQLQPSEVLVVYDSRIPDSLAVAEYYAGSLKVPGGTGAEPGVHPGVHVFNLQTAGQLPPPTGTTFYAHYVTRIRNPIRAHLLASNLQTQVRCIVTTKGMPHRVDDDDFNGVGDNPGQLVNEFNAGDATCASLCTELALLWQDLNATETGIGGDSRADGWILNPLWRQTRPATTFSNAHARNTNKAWTQASGVGFGQGWTTLTTQGPDRILSPGDIMLVSALDGTTVADVKAMIARAQNLEFNVDTAAFILDESNSNGVADPNANTELDNQAPASTRFSDDYESSRDRVVNDRRFDPTNVFYNSGNDAQNFIVGPRINYGGQGIVVSDPVLVLAHYGQNHAGTKPGGTAGTTYADSFNYAPGAFFCTMESFNGRKFGGLGDSGQEQAADFITAGGTFAICNVWEPFANFTADVDLVVRSFYLGQMTWVEAAFTAIPCLSWQQMVVGDPLATAHRSVEDLDNDGDVDIDDLYEWNDNPVDLNRSGAADAVDLALLEAAVRKWDHFATRR